MAPSQDVTTRSISTRRTNSPLLEPPPLVPRLDEQGGSRLLATPTGLGNNAWHILLPGKRW